MRKRVAVRCVTGLVDSYMRNASTLKSQELTESLLLSRIGTRHDDAPRVSAFL